MTYATAIFSSCNEHSPSMFKFDERLQTNADCNIIRRLGKIATRRCHKANCTTGRGDEGEIENAPNSITT